MREEYIILISLILVFILFGAILYKLRREYWSYTRILCGNGYCVDVYIECDNDKVRNITIISDPVRMNYTESSLGYCKRFTG